MPPPFFADSGEPRRFKAWNRITVALLLLFVFAGVLSIYVLYHDDRPEWTTAMGTVTVVIGSVYLLAVLTMLDFWSDIGKPMRDGVVERDMMAGEWVAAGLLLAIGGLLARAASTPLSDRAKRVGRGLSIGALSTSGLVLAMHVLLLFKR